MIPTSTQELRSQRYLLYSYSIWLIIVLIFILKIKQGSNTDG